MYHFLGSDPAHVTDSDLMRFSFEGQTQKHSVLDLSNNVLDFLLYINTNGKEEFNFEGELEVRFKYYFINKAKPEDAVIEKPNNVMKFKILAKAINPFELSFDYQLLNPLVKHLNYDSSSMKKLFVVNEKCWINLTIDNLHNPILIQSIKFETTASEEDIKIIKPIQMTGSS